jgi:MASE1
MDEKRWEYIARGVAVTSLYFVAYIAGWLSSLDQWFLAGGLRVTALLLLPYRYWPFFLLGDIGALLALRLPREAYDGAHWSYFSPVLLPAVMTLVPLLVRQRLTSPASVAKWLPVLLILSAAWGAASNVFVNEILSGPPSINSLDMFVRVTVGYYLGSLIIILPFLLWLLPNAFPGTFRTYVRDALFALVTFCLIYGAGAWSQNLGSEVRQGILMLMIVPALGMTLQHGWRGAALGITALMIAIWLVLPHFNFESAHDESIFVVQKVLALLTAVMLPLGWIISVHDRKARFEAAQKEQSLEVASLAMRQAQRDAAEKEESMEIARLSFVSAETLLREQMLFMTQMQVAVEDELSDVVSLLRNNGDPSAAMDLNARGVMQRRAFNEQATWMYPIQIEEKGLHSVLRSSSFVDFRSGDADVKFSFRGNSWDLTLDLQRNAYRCICDAIALLSASDPDVYKIKTRIWHQDSRNGILISITAINPLRPSVNEPLSNANVMAGTLLYARSKAHGGRFRRHANRISVRLSEPAERKNVQ